MFHPSPQMVIVTIPTDDSIFHAYVHLAYAEVLAPEGRSSRAEPGRLESAIRLRYAEAHVRPRNLSGELVTTWYVYRDGGWRPSPADVDRPRHR